MSNKVQYLYCKPDGCYYFRRNIPLTLKLYFPKSTPEIRKSLKTKCLKTAKINIKAWSLRVEKLFTLMRSGMLTDEQLIKIAQDFFHDYLRKDEQYRADPIFALNYYKMPDDQYYQCAIPISDFMEDLDEEITNRKTTIIDKLLKPFLEEQGITIDDEEKYQYLARQASINLMEAYKIESARNDGNYNNTYDRRSEQLTRPVQLQTQPQTVTPKEDTGALLSEVVTLFLDDKENNLMKDKRKKNPDLIWPEKATYKSFFANVVEILGDVPIKSIGSRNIFGLRDTLRKLPPNKNTGLKYKGKSIKQLLQMETDKTISITTLNMRMGFLGDLFNYAKDHEHIEVNNFPSSNRIKLKNKVPKNERKQNYSRTELQKIVNLMPKNLPADKQPSYFWVTVIGMFTGMRQNEICQLYTNDIIVDETTGVLCFDVLAEEDDQGTKTDSSYRLVPVHPFLKELGLIKHQKQCRARKDERLWMGLTLNNKGKYNARFQKWYNEEFNRIYIIPDMSIKKTFHSLRHNFQDNLKQKEVDLQVIREIVGHAGTGTTTDIYVQRYNTQICYDAMLKLDYGIDLTPLKEKAKALLNK